MTKVIQNAKAATEKEQSMSLMQGIRLYPKAVLWSVLISTCIAMEGYDISLVNNFYAFPQFNRKYGELLADGSYEVSAAVSSTNSGSGHPSISWSGVGLPLCGMKKLTIV
jgi:SP family general alpha glucoside:H+ symporter-like MFS transporter